LFVLLLHTLILTRSYWDNATSDQCKHQSFSQSNAELCPTPHPTLHP